MNEEGLPIIDINEPVAINAESTPSSLSREFLSLPSLATLSPEDKEIWRKRKDYILDKLEAEERRAGVPKEQKDEVFSQEKLAEQRLRQAVELQKKMGKALLHCSDEGRYVMRPSGTIVPKMAEKGHLSQQKTIRFVEPSDTNEKEVPSSAEKWGDVTLARLRSKGPSLLIRAQPMKDLVVERVPQTFSSDKNIPDSDDESDFEPDSEDDDEVYAYADEPQDTEDSLLDQDDGLDFARYQQEIAQQYYKKRETFMKIASEAASSSEEPVPDAPSTDKPSISRFKASRLASANGLCTSPSSLGDNPFVPSFTHQTLQKKIRTGKLNAAGQLIGNSSDSESEAEVGEIQEVVELLKKGGVYNIGPGGERMCVIQPPTSQKGGQQTTTLDPGSAMSFDNLPAIRKPSTSRFKASRCSRRPPTSDPASNLDSRAVGAGSTPAVSDVFERIPGAVGGPGGSICAAPSVRPSGKFSASVKSFSMANQSTPFSKPTISEVLFSEPTGSRLARPPAVLSPVDASTHEQKSKADQDFY